MPQRGRQRPVSASRRTYRPWSDASRDPHPRSGHQHRTALVHRRPAPRPSPHGRVPAAPALPARAAAAGRPHRPALPWTRPARRRAVPTRAAPAAPSGSTHRRSPEPGRSPRDGSRSPQPDRPARPHHDVSPARVAQEPCRPATSTCLPRPPRCGPPAPAGQHRSRAHPPPRAHQPPHVPPRWQPAVVARTGSPASRAPASPASTPLQDAAHRQPPASPQPRHPPAVAAPIHAARHPAARPPAGYRPTCRDATGRACCRPPRSSPANRPAPRRRPVAWVEAAPSDVAGRAR